MKFGGKWFLNPGLYGRYLTRRERVTKIQLGDFLSADVVVWPSNSMISDHNEVD